MANEDEPTLDAKLDGLLDAVEYGGCWPDTRQKARAAIIDRDARIRAERDAIEEMALEDHKEHCRLMEGVEAERDQAIAERDRERQVKCPNCGVWATLAAAPPPPDVERKP